MKQFLQILLLAGLSTSLASCKKEYVCNCTVTDDDGTTKSYQVPLGVQKKNDVEQACNDAGAQYLIIGGTCKYAEK